MKNQRGFTLIELLVVVSIIGILAVIGIKQFAFYRANAFCSMVQSDVKNTVTALEGAYAENQDYTTYPGPITSDVLVTVSASPTVTTIGNVTGSHPDCVDSSGGSKIFTFNSTTGLYSW